MKKNLSAFAHLFEADTGMDVRDPFVSAWSDAIIQVNKQRNRKFVSTDVESWLRTMKEEACNFDDSVTVEVHMDSHNDLFCVCMIDSSGSAEFCVPPPRTPKGKKENAILDIINGGQEAHEEFRRMIIDFCQLGAGNEPAETESDKHERVFSEDEEDMSDEQIEEEARKLDKAASLANNQHAAYLIELAASRLRELKNG